MSGDIGNIGQDNARIQGKIGNYPKQNISDNNSDISLDSFQKSIGDETLGKIPQDALKFFKKGNKVQPLFNSKITPDNKNDDMLPVIEDTIKGAKDSIQLEMFSFDKKSLVDLMINEAQKGVKVQIILDPPNEGWEKDKADAMEKMKKNGIEVLTYPIAEPNGKSQQIDHVKMLIVDGKKAIIGGMNWGEVSFKNHDFDVKVEGPAVNRMSGVFKEDWLKSGGEESALPPYKPVQAQGDAMINIVTSGTEPREQTIGKTVVRAINNAKRSVHAELFVLTERKTVEALKGAKARGLDVKVIVNPLKINDFAVNEKAAKELKDAGVEVKWYTGEDEKKHKLHGKMGIFDDDQVILGSANWSYAGYRVNREADAEILSKEVNSEFENVFKDDWNTKTSDEPIYKPSEDDTAGG